MRSFGQFKKAQKVQRGFDLSSADKAIVKAFQQGQNAGRSDLPRSSPYRPEGEQEKHEAWTWGYDEEAPRYACS